VGEGEGRWGNVTNIQYVSNWNCHYKSPLYNKYTLIKNYKINHKIIVSYIQTYYFSCPPAGKNKCYKHSSYLKNVYINVNKCLIYK
jgi:hypothetical protein